MNNAKIIEVMPARSSADYKPFGRSLARYSETSLSTAFFLLNESMPNTFVQAELFCRLRPDLGFIHANEAFLKCYGLDAESLQEHYLWSMIPADKHEEMNRIIALFSPDNPTRTYEYRAGVSGEGFICQQWTIWALFGQDGDITEYLAVVRDVTDRKVTEEKLRHRLAIEETVALISKLLLRPENADMNSILETLGRVFAVTGVYLFEAEHMSVSKGRSYKWNRGDRKPQQSNLFNTNEVLPGWRYRFDKCESVIIPSIDRLAPDAADNMFNIPHTPNSLLAVPIRDTQMELLGFLGLEDTREKRLWLDEDIRYLTVVAGMLSSYWIRNRTRYELETKVMERTAKLIRLNTELRREIAERQAAEKEKEISEIRYRTIVENQTEIVFRTLPDLSISFVNSRYLKVFGGRAEDHIGKYVLWPVIKEDEPDALSVIERMTPEDPEVVYSIRIRDEAGRTIWMEVTGSAIYKNGILVEYQGVGRDITERKKQEEALERSEANFRVLGETSPAMIFVIQNGLLRYVNSAALNTLGYSRDELINTECLKLIHPAYQELALADSAARFNNETLPPYKTRLISKDGQDIWGFASINIIDFEDRPAIVGVIVDITELQKMEEEIIKASKLESVGMLAGGIAHDFNNILTVISGNVSLAKLLIDADSEVAELLKEVEDASMQARELTQQLLTFSRGGAPIREAASIEELIMDSVSFVLRGSNVRCIFQNPEDLPAVNVDKGQISQVINNLIINADQAMPEGGIINVTADTVKIRKDSALPLKSGDYVKITIKDQGVGIPRKYLDKIFDPYFTTKQKGHGLGLATCYSIMKKHDGSIQIESQPGVGTTIQLYLPALPHKASKRQKKETPPVAGRGRVLIMDDENNIRNTLGRMVKKLGYEVEYAQDGIKALESYKLAKQTHRPFDAVIMDLTIPGSMGGKETVKLLLEMDPAARAIVSSGYSNDPVMADYQDYGFKGVIPKPYKIQELSTVLNAVITEE